MPKILLVGAEPDKMPRLKLVYKSLKTLGYDVRVFAPFQRKGNSIMRYLANMTKLMFECAEIYHFFNIPDIIGIPLLFKRGKLVYDVRSPWEEIVLDSTGNKILAKIAGMIERIFCLKADSVVSANPLLGERAKMFGVKDFVNVPNFPYEEMSTEGWETISKMYRKSQLKKDALVLFFGKISIPEGSNVLAKLIIDTLNEKQDMFNIHFIILGDGPEFQNLIDKIADAGIYYLRRVRFLGLVPHKMVGQFIQAADLCIVPREEGGTTTWTHPDSIWKINESLNIGTPVLATKYGGLRWDASLPSFIVTRNKDFSIAIINMLEVILRWGKDSKIPVKRDWIICREALRNVYEGLR